MSKTSKSSVRTQPADNKAAKKSKNTAPDSTPTLSELGNGLQANAKQAAKAIASAAKVAAKGAKAAIEITITVYELHKAYEWLHPIFLSALTQFSRQADAWTADISKPTSVEEQGELLKKLLARTDLYRAVIQKAADTAAEMARERAELKSTQVEAFAMALLEGLEQEAHDLLAEQAGAIVLRAQLSALLPPRGAAKRRRPISI